MPKNPALRSRRASTPPSHPRSRYVRGKFPCPQCDKVAVNAGALTKHLEKRHGVKIEFAKRDLTCPECPKTFGRQQGFVRHVAQTHGIKNDAAFMILLARIGVAPLPGEVASNGSAPPPPTDLLGVDPEHPLNCPECDFVAKTRMGLGSHRSIQHGVRGKFYKSKADRVPCPECDFTAKNERTLQLHRRNKHGAGSRDIVPANLLEVCPQTMPPGTSVVLGPARQANFCPNCGVRAGNFCSECGANMNLVRTALNFRG